MVFFLAYDDGKPVASLTLIKKILDAISLDMYVM